MNIETINVSKKLGLFSDYWHPRIVGEVNDHHVKLAKLKGDFIWHKHENEDEFFYVLNGVLKIEFRDGIKTINPGEFIIVPKQTEHRPFCEEEVSVMLFEPKSTINTGNENSDLRKDDLQII